jgi:nitroreductase
MDTIAAIHGRRSIRSYAQRAVDRSLIADLIWDAAQAPTPPISGISPWAFCVVEGVARIAAYGDRAKQYARDHPLEGRPQSWPHDPAFKVFWDAPVLVLICGARDNVEAAHDCCRAGQNLLLAAYARGLGSCWVGAPMPWLASPGVADELRLPSGFDPIAAIVIGYAIEGASGRPRRRPTIHWCESGAAAGDAASDEASAHASDATVAGASELR